MKKEIIFTAIFVIIASGSIIFGLLSFRPAEEPQTKVIEIVEVIEVIEVIDESVVRQKGPIASLLLPDIDSESGIQNTLTEKSDEILGVWAVLSKLSSVIYVLETAEFNGNFFSDASINPLVILTSVGKILDKISNNFLWAFSAIIFQKVLLAISGFLVFLIIIPICVIISIAAVWTYKDKKKLIRVITVSIVISLVIPFVLPISFQVPALIEKSVLTDNMEKILSSVEENNSLIEVMEDEITGFRRTGRSISGYLPNVNELGGALIKDAVSYFNIFIILNFVIPIITIFCICFLIVYFARKMLKK